MKKLLLLVAVAKGDPTAASFFAQLLSNLGPLP